MIVVWGILSKGTTLVLIEESKLFSDYYGKPSLIRCLFEINMLKDNLFLSACVLSRFFFFFFAGYRVSENPMSSFPNLLLC